MKKRYKVDFNISTTETKVYYHNPTETMHFGKAKYTKETKSCYTFFEIVAVYGGVFAVASYPDSKFLNVIPESEVKRLVDDFNSKKALFIKLDLDDKINHKKLSEAKSIALAESILEKHWKKVTNLPFDKTIKNHMKYVVDAMIEFKNI